MNIFFIQKKYFTIICIIFFLMAQVSFAQSPSGKDVEQLDFAHGLFQRDFYDMASSEYQKFITIFPESPYLHEAYFGIAEGAFFLKDYEKAIAGYSKYLELFPEGEKVPMVQMRLGQTLFLTDKYEDALGYFLKVSVESLSVDFKQTLYFYTGKSYRLTGELKLAREFLEKGVSVSGEHQNAVYALLEMAEILEQEKKYSEAMAYYARVYARAKQEEMKAFTLYKQGEMQFSLQDYVSAAETFKRVLGQYPKETIHKEALANLLLALFNLSKYDDVVSTFKNNQNVIQETSSFFDMYYITASAYFQLTKYMKALELVDKMLVWKDLSDDQRNKAALKKVEIFVKVRHFQEAVDLINTELASAVTNQEKIVFLKAESFYGLENYEAAYETYKGIVTRFPESSFVLDALYGAAHARNASGNSQEAMDLFEEYFQKGKEKIKRMKALYNALLIGRTLGLSKKSVDFCQTYLAAFPESTHNEKVLFWLGALYADEKQYEKSIEALQRFISEYPESSQQQEAYFLLAFNLQQVDNLEESLIYYEKIESNEQDRSVLYSALKNSAYIYFQKKQEQKAAMVIDKILMEFPDNDLEVKTGLWLAQRYLDRKKFKDVLRVLEKIKISEDDLRNQEAAAYFNAQASKEILDYANAIEQYDLVLTIDADNAYDGVARIGKALCLMGIKEFVAARAELDAAVLENAEDNTITMRARFEVANMEKMQGHLEEAAKFYMLVAVLYADEYYTPEALWNAGKAFESLGRVEDAQKVFQEIINDYPTSPAAERVKKGMNES